MKNIHLLLIIFSIILIIGCNRTKEKYYTVSGTVDDLEIAKVTLITNDSTYSEILKNGCFSFTVKSGDEQYVDLETGSRTSLYLKPGDRISLDFKNKGLCTFKGRGFEESEFLYKKQQLLKELGFDDPRKIDIALFSSPPVVFQTKIDSIRQILINQLEDYHEQHPGLSASFYNIELNSIEYFVFNQLFLYPEFHELLTKNKPDLPENYYEYIERINPNIKELYVFKEYRSVINSLLDHHSKTFNEKYYLAKETLRNTDFFKELLYNEFHRYINFNGIDDIDSIYTEFIEYLEDSEQKNSLQEKYTSWKRLAKGEIAPEFKINDVNGNLVKLSDFRGKYVYIDCWSSYCGPCIAEMPSMKKLSEDLGNKNVVFISISADQDNNRWLSKVNEFDLNAVNLCTEGTKHEFNIDYNAKAFPRYILIDDKGYIIDATADKPSEIREKLQQIL